MQFFRIILALLGGTHALYAQPSAAPTVKSTGEFNFLYNIIHYCSARDTFIRHIVFPAVEIENTVMFLLNSDLMNMYIYAFISEFLARFITYFMSIIKSEMILC